MGELKAKNKNRESNIVCLHKLRHFFLKSYQVFADEMGVDIMPHPPLV